MCIFSCQHLHLQLSPCRSAALRVCAVRAVPSTMQYFARSVGALYVKTYCKHKKSTILHGDCALHWWHKVKCQFSVRNLVLKAYSAASSNGITCRSVSPAAQYVCRSALVRDEARAPQGSLLCTNSEDLSSSCLPC